MPFADCSAVISEAAEISETIEQRRAPRIPCDLRVLVIIPPAVFGPGVLLNVSTSGALLQTPLALDPLMQIELEVEGTGISRSSIRASVTRRDLQEYGVEFRSANTATIGRMLQMAEAQTGSARGDAPAYPVAPSIAE